MSGKTEQFDVTTDAIVPAARVEGLTWADAGEDLVIYDAEPMHYHSLNATAAAVWRLCDGRRTVSRIAAETGFATPVVELAVADLGDLGLLQSPETSWNAGMTRRRVLKLAAAGGVGAVAIPVIASMTAPNAASAQSVGCVQRNGDCRNGKICCAPATCQPSTGASFKCL